MAQANLAIGAGGATTWERMCLGLPTVVVSNAENQRPACRALAEEELIYYAGHYSDVSSECLADLIRTLVSGADELAAQRARVQTFVDGMGTLRMVEALLPSSCDEIRLRPANEQDIDLYFNWANEPAVRLNAINTATISWATHEVWFVAKLQDQNSWLFVLEAGGLPVGQIRFDKEEDKAHIDYSLDPVVRGRGWGKRLVTMGASLIHQVSPLKLCAKVKISNVASTSIFLALGFEVASNSDAEGYRSFYSNPFSPAGAVQ
jgi:UDP-2,4-diacetamido-2,4,6-trideoxy-beta-L-altropyranose hydrolase